MDEQSSSIEHSPGYVEHILHHCGLELFKIMQKDGKAGLLVCSQVTSCAVIVVCTGHAPSDLYQASSTLTS